MTRLSKYEKETIILTSEGDSQYNIYTFNHYLKGKLRTFSEEYPEHCRKLDIPYLAEGAETYLIDKNCMSVRFNRPYSEEAREKARQRAKRMVLDPDSNKCSLSSLL